MDVTFRESKPYYGEKTDLSSLFELGDPSVNQDGREGEIGVDKLQEKKNDDSREAVTITGLIPILVSNSYVDRRQENKDIGNIHATQKQGTWRVYTRRNKNNELQQVEQQVEHPQLMERHNSSAIDGARNGAKLLKMRLIK
jgi:hypothetical protein